MWIVITTPFIDKQATEPKDAEVPAGKKMNVTAERGKELIDLGLAEASEGETAAAKPARAKAKPKDQTAETAPVASVVAEPAHEHVPPVKTGVEPIAPGFAGTIDGPVAGENTTHD